MVFAVGKTTMKFYHEIQTGIQTFMVFYPPQQKLKLIMECVIGKNGCQYQSRECQAMPQPAVATPLKFLGYTHTKQSKAFESYAKHSLVQANPLRVGQVNHRKAIRVSWREVAEPKVPQ